MRNIISILLILHLLPVACCFAYADEKENQQDEVYQLGEISVTPGRFSIDVGAPSPYLIPKSQMEKLPLIDNDIFRTAHSLPGVVADDFSARFSLRGGDRDEVLIRLDGMELYDPYHLQDFGGAISVIDLGIVKHADLLTGGFPAEYGDVMSGVFDVTSGEGHRGRITGDMGIDLLNTHAIAEIPYSIGSWLISARRGYIDLLMGMIESDEVFKPRYYDIYSKLTYDVSSADRLSIHALYAGDDNEIDEIGEDNDVNSNYKNGIFWTKWKHIAGEKTFWEFYLFGGLAGREKYEGIDGVDKRSLSYGGLKYDLVYNPFISHMFKAGCRLSLAQADYKYFLSEDTAVTSVDANPDGWDLSAYVQDEWHITEHVGGNMGLRYMFQSYGGYSSIMPRVALFARPRDDLILRVAWGMYNQPVQVISLPVEEGVAEAHPPEKAVHYVLSAEYSPMVNLLVRTELYYKTFDDLVGQIKDYGRKEQIFISPESGSSKGIEFYIRHSPLPRLLWGLAYAISRSEIKVEGRMIPKNFDRTHSVNINANYALWADGGLNIVWRFHTGDPYTEAWYEKTLLPDESSFVWEKNYGTLNGKRYPAYHSLDLRLTKNFQLKRWSLSLYFQIMNLYNRKNVHEYSFEQMVDDEENIYYERITEGLLPILPSIGLSARF